ncbi:hypothetical protein EDB83DRAFT_2517978 [Lactarius deliciosus]|nr:hypothetical protein EDB83DRAFT_2517978 [Lactarius deliciosus]
MYVVAIKDARARSSMTPAQLSMVGFRNLIFVLAQAAATMAFLPPVGTRRWAGSSQEHAFGFWCAWHRSYDLWIVRYLHIPLGGAKRFATFVALWHDLSTKLLALGWLAALFILPEVAARKAFPPSLFGDKWWYRHACAAGGVCNVSLMMGANLVGLDLGVDGTWYFCAN